MMKLSTNRLRGGRTGGRTGSGASDVALYLRYSRRARTRLCIHGASHKDGNDQKWNIRSTHLTRSKRCSL